MRFIILLTLFFSGSAIACDICGCFMGLTPYQNFSSVGLYYRYRSFNGYSAYGQTHRSFPSTIFRTTHGDAISEELASEKNYELFRVYELRGKFFLHPRIESTFLIPYYDNSNKIGGIRNQLKGVGDMNLLVGYHMLKLTDDPVFKHRLILGSGLKLGTGKYQISDSLNVRLDPMLQPGTGSIDALFYTNYYLQWREFGFSWNVLYKVNSKNLYQERFANSITNTTNLFWRFEIGMFQLIPMVQIYHEYTKGMYKNNEIISGTDMNELMIGPGLDFYYKGILVNTGYQRTIRSSVSPLEMGSAGRMVLGISYNFLQTNYIFNSKVNNK